MLQALYIFSDASYDPMSQRAVIGFLLSDTLDASLTSCQVSAKTIEKTTNSKAELEATLWALNSLSVAQKKKQIILITDSQALSQLAQRRAHLEKSDYRSKRSGMELSQASLYRKYFAITQELQIIVRWVQGHCQEARSTSEGMLFKIVDREVRRRLRKIIAD